MSRISAYEKRIRERFPALVADPIWPAVEKLVKEDWRDDYDDWWPGVQQHCIDLSKRLGLPLGPARCGQCERDWPEAGDVPDGQSPSDDACPECLAERAQRDAALAACGPIKIDQEGVRMLVYGLIKRDVK